MSFIAKNGRRFHWNGERAETGPDLPSRLGYSHTKRASSYRLKPDADGWTMTPVPDGPPARAEPGRGGGDHGSDRGGGARIARSNETPTPTRGRFG
jgi:hypothetical protein